MAVEMVEADSFSPNLPRREHIQGMAIAVYASGSTSTIVEGVPGLDPGDAVPSQTE